MAARGRREIQPFHQRSFYSANPDLSFHAMNGDEPLKTSPYHDDGRLERLELIRDKLPGIDEVITRATAEGRRPDAHDAGRGHAVDRPPGVWAGGEPAPRRSDVGRDRDACRARAMNPVR